MTRLADEMTDALRRLGAANRPGFVIAALYKFVDLPDFRELQPILQNLCDAHDIHGTLLLAGEGINGTVCGPRDGMAALLDWIDAEPRLAGLSLKFSTAPDQAFLRMKVRLKREIVTMGRPEIRPAQATGTYVEPAAWNALIDDPDVMVIDTRNRYETAIGSFAGAVDPGTDSFREFPAWAEQLAAADGARPKKLAMFCTGGIRCEKASALMQDFGFDEVYHLKGGILRYLEEVPREDSRWQGECFVFDNRVAVDHDLKPGQHAMCHACRMPLAPEDLEHEKYAPGVSCHHCHDRADNDKRQRLAERQRQISLARERGTAHLGAAARRQREGRQSD
jgi:UPF0176 protein